MRGVLAAANRFIAASVSLATLFASLAAAFSSFASLSAASLLASSASAISCASLASSSLADSSLASALLVISSFTQTSGLRSDGDRGAHAEEHNWTFSLIMATTSGNRVFEGTCLTSNVFKKVMKSSNAVTRM